MGRARSAFCRARSSLRRCCSCRAAMRSLSRSIVLVYWAVAFKPIWFGPYPYGVQAGGSGRALPGNPGRAARLDRSRRPDGSRRRRAMDGPHRPLHGEPERVLQPHGRARSTTRRPRRRAASREIRVGRPSDGVVPYAPPVRRSGYVPPRRTVGRARTPYRLARDSLLGVTLWRLNGPLVLAKTHERRALSGRQPGPGRVVTWTREHCHGRLVDGAAARRRAAVPGREHGDGRRRGDA